MNYFRINLNKLEDKSRVIKKMNREITGLILLSLLFVTATGFVGYRYQELRIKSGVFGAAIDTLTTQIKVLEQSENYISDNDVMDLYDLTSRRIFWTEKLEALADLVDTSIAFTGVTFQRDKLYLRGIARVSDNSNRFLTISTFIDSMKTSPVFSQDFNRIEFSSSERINYLNRDIVNFEVICRQNKN